MKKKGKKGKRLLKYVREHLAGTGIVVIIAGIVLGIAFGVSGEDLQFDPGDFAASFSSDMADSSGDTAFDLAEEGDSMEDVTHDSDRKQEQEESQKIEESEAVRDTEREQVILPDGMANGVKPSDTVDMAVNPDVTRPGTDSGSGQQGTGHEPPGNEDSESDKPGFEKPKPGKPSDDNEESRFVIYINGKKKTFNSEDEALIWVAENNGIDEDGRYFEGFVTDAGGKLTPSYADKSDFDTGADTSFGYTGSSSVYVVPDGVKNLELVTSTNDKIKTIVISKTVSSVVTSEGNQYYSLEKYVVSPDNPNYMSVDGVLYSKPGASGGTVLLSVPPAKTVISQWPGDVTAVGERAFYHSALEKLELPGTVEEIREAAFEDSGLAELTLPESVKRIGEFAFMFQTEKEDGTALSHKIVMKGSMPAAVTVNTFRFMEETEIFVPDSADDTVYEAYLAAWGPMLGRLTASLGDPLSVLKTVGGAETRYEYYADGTKTGFRRVGEQQFRCWWDSSGVYRADAEGNAALFRCTASGPMADFSQTGIASIYEGAFDGCSVKFIRLPETLKTMPENVFGDCRELKVLISYAPEPPADTLGISGECIVCVRAEALQKYQQAWQGQARKIMGTDTSYSATASGLVLDRGNTRIIDICTDVEGVSIPSYVTSIYEGAGAEHPNLKSITIPSNVKEVGNGAFAGCGSLDSVVWNTSVKVPDSAFEGCVSLTGFRTSASAGHQLTAIGRRAFYGCRQLGTVLWYSYQGSDGKNYIYYYRLESIGEEAFRGCTSMKYAFLYSSVISVGAGAFADSGLETMDWWCSADLPDRCFENSGALKTVGWGQSTAAAIGERTFYGCRGLETLTLPASAASLGGTAFGGRNGKALTLTFTGAQPAAWEPSSGDAKGLTVYVPDSQENGDVIYRAYLDAWKGWLGDHPEQILKTKDGAETRVKKTADGEGSREYEKDVTAAESVMTDGENTAAAESVTTDEENTAAAESVTADEENTAAIESPRSIEEGEKVFELEEQGRDRNDY